MTVWSVAYFASRNFRRRNRRLRPASEALLCFGGRWGATAPPLLRAFGVPLRAAMRGWPSAPDPEPAAETRLPQSDHPIPTTDRTTLGPLRPLAIPAACSPRSPRPALLRRRHTCHPTGLASSPKDKRRAVKRPCLPWDEFPVRAPEGCTSCHLVRVWTTEVGWLYGAFA